VKLYLSGLSRISVNKADVLNSNIRVCFEITSAEPLDHSSVDLHIYIEIGTLEFLNAIVNYRYQHSPVLELPGRCRSSVPKECAKLAERLGREICEALYHKGSERCQSTNPLRQL
jgi:hypothetical protein